MMPKANAAAREFLAQSEDSAVRSFDAAMAPACDALPAAVPALGGDLGIVTRLRQAIAGWTDGQLALAISVGLFAISAWPIALTEVPPYQDLPNHLAAVTVIEHPASYPEFVFNGFLKTNTALFAWLYFVGKLCGVKLASRLFALLVLAMNALVLPRVVLTFPCAPDPAEPRGAVGRARLVVASLFMWPMIHNWFVSMGMLDFALGVPLSLVTLILLDRQGKAPGWKNALLVAAAGVCTWYAHVFTLMVVQLLVVIHIATRSSWRERAQQARSMLLPLAPTAILVAISVHQHLTEGVGPMTGFMNKQQLLPPWELAYNLWAEWFWGFTWLSISSFVPAVVLAILGYMGRTKSPTFFSPIALVALLALYVFCPYIATNWFHVNSRLIPFIWVALLVRVPARLPKKLVGLLVLSCVLYSAGMGADFVRLDRDRAKFTAGISAVPEGARLLPLLFRRQVTSENTRSLLHAWGFYVIEKQTSAPLLFAHSKSFPVTYSSPPPPPRFSHLLLEGFAPSMINPTWMCGTLHQGSIVVNNCEAEYRARWVEFWNEATPVYDHVLLWDATPEALANVPSAYKVTFRQDKLTILERIGPERVAVHATR